MSDASTPQFGQDQPGYGPQDPHYGPNPPQTNASPQQYGYSPVQPYPVAPYLVAAPSRRTNGLAIASLVLGIVWIYWLGSILALIFGYVARNQIRETNQYGGGMATAGIVLGWVGVGFLCLFILSGVAGAFG